ncbi:MAG: signal peptidase I [Kiritimatiellae bacterium]|nr:signal peptidase I [Kiritimatiellia bacterium]
MNYLEKRKWRKIVKHLCHEAHHAGAMREDVCGPESLARLNAAVADLRGAWASRDANALEKTADAVEASVRAIYPPRNKPRLRENVEVFVVAIAVAMAVRAYFIQPFKIPTGSMQPSLNGITMDPEGQHQWYDTFPVNIGTFLLFGEKYVEVRAKASGQMQVVGVKEDTGEFLVQIGHKIHPIHRHAKLYFDPYNLPVVEQGQLLATGRRRVGDHIFVNRVKYNFLRPERGDVFVFSTQGIKHPAIRPDTFYIKRMVGLPGEKIQVDPPYLVADGKKIEEPFPFHRLLTDPAYQGYSLVSRSAETPAYLTRTDEAIQLGDEQYLPFGDNTLHSLDGRFFGGVNEHDIIGPAVFVYWPISSRWGVIR